MAKKTQYWIQENRPFDGKFNWFDYSEKGSVKDCFVKIGSIKKQTPQRVFRVVVRDIEESVIYNENQVQEENMKTIGSVFLMGFGMPNRMATVLEGESGKIYFKSEGIMVEAGKKALGEMIESVHSGETD